MKEWGQQLSVVGDVSAGGECGLSGSPVITSKQWLDSVVWPACRGHSPGPREGPVMWMSRGNLGPYRRWRKIENWTANSDAQLSFSKWMWKVTIRVLARPVITHTANVGACSARQFQFVNVAALILTTLQRAVSSQGESQKNCAQHWTDHRAV